MSKTIQFSIIIFIIVTMVTTSAQDDTDKKKTADEIARELSNPVGSLASMVFQGTWTFWDGTLEEASDQTSGAIVFMPTLPFKIWGGNLVVRPSFPVAGVPRLNTDGNWEKKYGFGDMVVMANWGKMEKSGIKK